MLCYEGEWIVIASIGIAMLLVYAVLVPMFLFRALIKMLDSHLYIFSLFLLGTRSLETAFFSAPKTIPSRQRMPTQAGINIAKVAVLGVDDLREPRGR